MLLLRRFWSSVFGPPFLLVLIVLLPRLCAAAFIVTPARDMVRYVEAADMLRTLPLRDAVRSMDCHPLYPAALSGAQSLLWQFFGLSGPMSWVAAGEVVGIGSYILFLLTAYAVGLKTLSRQAAFWGCAIVALLPRQVSYSVDVLTDSLHAWLWITCLYFLMSVERPNPAWRFGLAGLFAGFAFWTRAEAMLLPVLAFAGGVAVQIVPSWRLPWRTAGACAAAFGIAWGATAGAFIGTLGKLSNRNSAAALTGQLTTAEPIVAPSNNFANVGDTAIPPPNAKPTLFASPSEAPRPNPQSPAPETIESKPLDLAAKRYSGDEAYELRNFRRSVVGLVYEIAQETRVWMLPFVLWGLMATRRLFMRPDYIFWVIAWLGYSAMLILLQMKCGYVAGRYLMPLIPSLGSLAAVGIGEFIRASVMAPRWWLVVLDKIGLGFRPKQRGRVALLAVFLVALGTSVPAWFRSNHRHRQTYLQAAEWIKAHTQAGEAVFDPINLVSFYADRPNWRPTHPEQPIPVRYAVVDVERVYRTDLCSHGVIKRFNAVGKPVATFVQPKSHRQGVVHIFEWPSATNVGANEGRWR
jgi:hypothetical protein